MVRPHPGFWRIIHGIVTLYLLVLVFVLFQNVDDARSYLKVSPPIHCLFCFVELSFPTDIEALKVFMTTLFEALACRAYSCMHSMRDQLHGSPCCAPANSQLMLVIGQSQ